MFEFGDKLEFAAKAVRDNGERLMYFLVDHENVKSNGYKGVEFLLPEDTIEIFYSEYGKNIPRGMFRDMDKLNEIEGIFRKKSSKKILYLDSLKRFGKKNGVYIYNCMKGLVV